MAHLDPFIVYTVKLAMDYKSIQESTTCKKPTSTLHPDATIYYPSTMAKIMSMKQWHKKPGEKCPKPTKDNLLTLLYYADEQWMYYSNQLLSITSSPICDSKKLNNAIHHVHRQQRIYLDTLLLLHRSILPDQCHKRFNEPIFFAAQVIYRQCHIRHLESYTDFIYPKAIQLIEALECVRHVTKSQYILQEKSGAFSFSSLFSSSSSSWYMKVPDRAVLEPALTQFSKCWAQFEDTLYDCYVNTVFGNTTPKPIPLEIKSPLPQALFQDSFTQLLPLALERAIQQNAIDVNLILTLDPVAFIAVPRLALLAGMTWLSHMTGWRNQNKHGLPIWIQTNSILLEKIAQSLDLLEFQLLQTKSDETSHLNFVQVFSNLEKSFIMGKTEEMSGLERCIFLDICKVADNILSSVHARAFSNILYHLFSHFGIEYDQDYDQDAVPLESTVMDLAV